MRTAHYLAETKLVRTVAWQRFVTYSLSDHAKEEMGKDGIDLVDIRNIARSGNVTRIELVGNRWRLTVTGVDGEGDVITAVVAIDEEASRICVITAWKQRNRRR